MSTSTNEGSCALSSWLLAVLVGILAAIVAKLFGDLSATGSIFVGIIAAVFFGLLFNWLFCRPMKSLDELRAEQAATAAPAPAAAPAPEPAAQPAAAAAPAVAAEPAPAPKPKPKPKAQPKAKAKPKPKADPAPATGEGKRPKALKAARGGKADDLKQIKGIGPKLEKLCNTLGFYHFDQIAAWTADEVAWVDQNLEGFKGRVTRDTWVQQASILASGGTTEFSKKVGKGGVYD